jgi:hypothetical protein
MDPLGQLLEQLPHPNMQQVQEKFMLTFSYSESFSTRAGKQDLTFPG